MSITTIQHELNDQLSGLSEAKQRMVLEFARSLAFESPSRTSGRDLLIYAGSIPNADLEQMRKAIESDCEQVDVHGW